MFDELRRRGVNISGAARQMIEWLHKIETGQAAPRHYLEQLLEETQAERLDLEAAVRVAADRERRLSAELIELTGGTVAKESTLSILDLQRLNALAIIVEVNDEMTGIGFNDMTNEQKNLYGQAVRINDEWATPEGARKWGPRPATLEAMRAEHQLLAGAAEVASSDPLVALMLKASINGSAADLDVGPHKATLERIEELGAGVDEGLLDEGDINKITGGG